MIGKSPVRFEYISAPLTVWPTVNATEFLVAIAPKKYNRLAVIDVGRSLQKIVMDATRMGLGTCWIGPGADHASIMKVPGGSFQRRGRPYHLCMCCWIQIRVYPSVHPCLQCAVLPPPSALLTLFHRPTTNRTFEPGSGTFQSVWTQLRDMSVGSIFI